MDRGVDLYTLRCAAAALLVARNSPLALTTGELQRLDVAVRHLVACRDQLTGEIADTVAAVLSADPDDNGARTTAAIDTLAQLTAVDVDNAPALAALLPIPEHAATGQRCRRHSAAPTLFDPDDGDDHR